MSTNNEHSTASSKAITILLTTHDQSVQLGRCLTALLEQKYEGGFEVVVVVDGPSTDDTEEVLQQLKATHGNLYSTYIPDTSHYVSRRKLALTIGMKAAHNEWVVLTEADCRPETDGWLAAMAAHMTADADAVCAYTAYEDGTPGRYVYWRLLAWWRLRQCPYRYDGACLALRRSVFMERRGFLANLKQLRGEYDFLVNETDHHRIVVATEPDCRLVQESPSTKEWANAQLYYMNTRPHLRRAFMPRLLFCAGQAVVHLCYVFFIGVLVWALAAHHFQTAAIAAALLTLLLGWRTWFGHRLAKANGEHVAWWKLPVLDLWVAWHYLYCWLRYQLASKNDFMRK